MSNNGEQEYSFLIDLRGNVSVSVGGVNHERSCRDKCQRGKNFGDCESDILSRFSSLPGYKMFILFLICVLIFVLYRKEVSVEEVSVENTEPKNTTKSVGHK